VPALRFSPPRAAALIAAVAAAFVVGLFIGRPSSGPDALVVTPDKDRHEAPDFTLKDADGKFVKFSDYRGKVVLLNFWATWCTPCRLEIPWFTDMERQNRSKGLEVVGISMDDEGWTVVKPFLTDLNVNYRVLMGDDSTAKKYGGIDSLPTSFLIDRAGKIAAVYVGLSSRKDYENAIDALLQTPVPRAGAVGP
jgi:peroxiredoxin